LIERRIEVSILLSFYSPIEMLRKKKGGINSSLGKGHPQLRGIMSGKSYLTLPAALDAAPIPTSRATKTVICAIVVALVVIEVDTADINVSPATSRTTAMAMTYPKIGWTLSSRPIF